MKFLRILAVLLCLLVVTVLFMAIIYKQPLTTAEFTRRMEAMGFTVEEITDEDSRASTVLSAYNGRYSIEFYEFASSTMAASTLNKWRNFYEEEYTHKFMVSEAYGENYSRYRFSSTKQFHMMCQIEETLLFCEVRLGNKKEVLQIAQALGYK